ncbi:TolC family outer membrane protein [Cellvibrio sp. pealriver]|uniref:TolC family outer membrane protein n=1 Tax=Cellvibrio sp. pealriver TaxID=1622269 RepID=UPI00069E5D86|nr:TolC family outer membrane protein [Cellvibrio sp. pealriver]
MKKTKLYLLISLFSLAPLTASANSLLDVYELALQNDAQLKADKAAYEAGLQNKTIGRAGLLPQINAKAQYSNSDEDSVNRLNNTTSPTDLDSKGWDVTLNQPLFDMSAWYVYKQGAKLSEQAEAQFGADQQSLIVRTAEAYFNVLRSIETLEATIAEEKALAKQLEQTKQRFEVGLTAITEVHEAQAAFDSARASTLEARGNLGISYEALEVLTGKPEDNVAPLSAKFPVVTPTPANRAEWVEFSLKNNYNLKASKLQAEASLQNAKANRSNHLPTLGATLGYSDYDADGISNGNPLDNSTDGTSLNVRLDIPIYSGGATTGRSRQAYAQYNQAHELYNSTQRNVIQNTRALHLSVETDVAAVQARKQAIVSNQSALEATQSGYEVGTRNLVEVLLAQRNLYQARRDYSNALYDYVIDTIKLREVAGMLTPADVQEIDKWLLDDSLVSRSQYEN